MAKSRIPVQSGIELNLSKPRVEEYDKSLKIRKIGVDNLYYQHLREFMLTSPTLNLCVTRQTDVLFGEYDAPANSLLSNCIVYQLLTDYSLFGGFAILVTYSDFGEPDSLSYIPFECCRLHEQGSNGIYSKIAVCSDWEGARTQNGKRINPKTDRIDYFTFTADMDTRLRRIAAAGGAEQYRGEVLYYSNTMAYPTGPCDSILQWISSEVGLGNLVLRDVRQSFISSAIVAIPHSSAMDEDDFANTLSTLQGDVNAGKIVLFTSNSMDEKPEMVSLQSEGTDTRFENAKTDCKNRIIDVFNQQCFTRLAEGSLGFGSEAISDIYKYYSWSLRPRRIKIEAVLQQLDPAFELKELVYQYQSASSVNNEENLG